MTIEAELLSPIIGDGSSVANAWRSQLEDDLVAAQASGHSYKLTDSVDNPDMPRDPALTSARIVVSDAVFTQVSGNADYYVLWDTPNPRSPDQAPPAAEFGQLRAYMARAGVSNADFVAAFGHGPNGRTRSQIAGEVSAWLRDRPKGAAKK